MPQRQGNPTSSVVEQSCQGVRRMLLSALVLLCCGLVSGQRILEVDKVVVPRCCPPGLALSLDKRFRNTLLPANVQALCTTVFDERAWKPRIFASGYLERRRVPSHWQLEYSRVPTCAKLRATPWFGMGLSNSTGSLLVITNHFSHVVFNRFCADASVVLVCQPDVLKCCPTGFRVEDEQCRPNFVFHDYNHTELILNQSIPLHQLLNSEDGTASVGFPTCVNGCKLGMVGDLDEASYEKDGVLQLGTVQLGPDEWCGGQLINSNNMSVFACVPQDFFWRKEEAKENEEDEAMVISKELLEADQRDAGLLGCKKKEEVRKHEEEKALINLIDIISEADKLDAEQAVNQKLQEDFLKAWKIEGIPKQNEVLTIQEGTQNESWISRNKWRVVLWVLLGLFGCVRVCRACKDKSQRQETQRDSNQTVSSNEVGYLKMTS